MGSEAVDFWSEGPDRAGLLARYSGLHNDYSTVGKDFKPARGKAKHTNEFQQTRMERCVLLRTVI